MGMVVRTNTMSTNAYRQLGMNNSAVSKSLEKLSSGFRINRAGDDASGLAISEKMKAQINGLEQASANSQDGISLIQTAEGATTEIHNMLNRMVTLATKSANGTIQNEVDREAIQTEVNALTTEITRIAKATNFNGINLLDGSLGSSTEYQAAPADAGGITGMSITGLDGTVKKVKVNTVASDAANTAAKAAAAIDSDGVLTLTINAKTDGSGVTAADVTSALQTVQTDATFAGTIGTVAASTGTAVDVAKTERTSATIAGTRGAGFEINFAKGKTGITSVQLTDAAATSSASNTNGVIAVVLDTAKSYTAADVNKILSEVGANGMTVSFDGAKTGADIETGLGLAAGENVTEGTGKMATGLKLQVGDTNAEFNHVTVAVDDLTADGLGVNGIDVSSQTTAGNSIDTIKAAINKVSTNRGQLGALQNRLEYTINNLDTTNENMTAANSRIRDTDMAKEMMNYTKMNILTQAAQAMLAQANQQPQQILQLLQ